ncbi:MAG TPA: glycoside hydrolase 43 family protein [Opitutaceae bacterium]|nr:glycoside hydrolase 43 family protein [Opitutaceae bacterium]
MNSCPALRWAGIAAALCAFVVGTRVRAADTPTPAPISWTADNGNGTYTNPLFYDEFSDPDLIRVGGDFYLAGTTMHAMPGLVVLHSKDLVNWTFLSYACDRLDLGPAYRLEDGREIYGQGFWAPCLCYHDGTFYIFSNVNGRKTQVFRAANPAGPWTRSEMGSSLHDLSVLFDDDGRIYVVWSYNEVLFAQLKPDLSDIIPGTKRVLIPAGRGMGEGHHFYKIHGKYYIISANYAPVGRMECARADRPEGPYETAVISAEETMGTQRSWWVRNVGLGRPVPPPGFKFDVSPPGDNELGAVPLHQGGIVDLPNGDWWGFSMMDFRAVGRTTFLSPVTWRDGWPYFGLPGNPGRSPRTWVKPAVGGDAAPSAPYERSDDFAGPELHPIWQWNHVPDDTKWSLTEKPGVLRLHTLPAGQFLLARDTLTQRAIGPVSTATVVLDGASLQPGDRAGLALLNLPCAWIGIVRTETGPVLRWYDELANRTIDSPLASARVSLRATADLDAEHARLSYSIDGRTFTPVGDEILLPYQLKTFQGTRYALFAYNAAGRDGGYADFARFRVDEPLADRSRDLPVGQVITLTNLADGTLAWAHPLGMLYRARPGSKEAEGPGARFRVLDRGRGRVALEAMDGSGFVTVVGVGLSADVQLHPQEDDGSLFQWQDLLRGQCMLLSLKTDRYVGLDPATEAPYSADWPGPRPDRRDGTVFAWTEAPSN